MILHDPRSVAQRMVQPRVWLPPSVQRHGLQALRRASRPAILTPRARAGAGAAGGTDANFADVSALLHMDGANGESTFTDHSQYAATYTSGAGAVTSTAQSVFGGASGFFDAATNNQVNVTGSGVLPGGVNYIPAGDFTVEWWQRPITLTVGQDWNSFAIRDTTASVFLAFCGSNSSPTDIRFVIRNAAGSTNVDFSATDSAYVINTWRYFACVADGSNARIYSGSAGGTAMQLVTQAITGTRSVTAARSLQMGNLQAGTTNRPVNGYIDDFRVTRMCRYPGGTAFPVPTAAFPNS